MNVEEKKRKKWNVMDLLLILVAIGAMLALLFYIQYRKGEEEDAVGIRCLLRIRGVDTRLFDAHEGNLIPVGSVVRNENATVRMGTVRGVTVLEHKRWVWRNGEAVAVTEGGLTDLEIEVRMQGHPKGKDGWRVKDLRVAAGGRGSFRLGNYYATNVEILAVEVLGEG